MPETFTLEIGALCDPISKQLAGLLPENKLAQFDAMNDAITTCYVHGLMSDGESDRARKRLLKKIKDAAGKR